MKKRIRDKKCYDSRRTLSRRLAKKYFCKTEDMLAVFSYNSFLSLTYKSLFRRLNKLNKLRKVKRRA